jgi:hypothetical protein
VGQPVKKSVVAASPTKLRSGEVRPLTLRLLGGLILWVSTIYCGPVTRHDGKKKGRGAEGAGLYPELAVLGFQEGNSPALCSVVARTLALLPSYALAQQELAQRGVPLDVKVVHGITCQAGAAALACRTRELQQYRAGLMPAGTALAGKRVAAFVDGGRVRLRTVTRKQRGRGKHKTQKRRYKAKWREPKLLIIYEVDEQGRMVAGTRPVIDGTFGGPDELLELLAMHLHRLGAAQAAVLSLGADGAAWFWDRLAWVVGRVGVPAERVVQTLDWCHGVHHIGLALAHLITDSAERRRVFKKLRKWLRQGGWQRVTNELSALAWAQELPLEHNVWTPIQYLERHGEAGHMDYARYRRRGLPLGSGAIESAIRRVINLRLKGNGIMWEEDNAEAVLVIRAHVLCNRWEERFAQVCQSMARNRRLDWEWQSPDMLEALNSKVPIKPPDAQPQATNGSSGVAA